MNAISRTMKQMILVILLMAGVFMAPAFGAGCNSISTNAGFRAIIELSCANKDENSQCTEISVNAKSLSPSTMIRFLGAGTCPASFAPPQNVQLTINAKSYPIPAEVSSILQGVVNNLDAKTKANLLSYLTNTSPVTLYFDFGYDGTGEGGICSIAMDGKTECDIGKYIESARCTLFDDTSATYLDGNCEKVFGNFISSILSSQVFGD